MTLDGIMFDKFFFSPFVIRVAFVMAKASVHPNMIDNVIMHEVVKGDVFEFIGIGSTKNWVVLCESRQDWF